MHRHLNIGRDRRVSLSTDAGERGHYRAVGRDIQMQNASNCTATQRLTIDAAVDQSMRIRTRASLESVMSSTTG